MSYYILRLRLYQPQAHYRIPFTYRRRHTYPIPPYSTLIGFLCNLLGYDKPPARFSQLKKLKISISGRFSYKTTEYTWFRNLSISAHTDRFGSIENRSLNGHVEHIGGQSPISIDVLNDVQLIIHLAHENDEFLKEIRSSIENPEKRLDILHLGRAEDWIVIEEISPIQSLANFKFKRVDGNFQHFFWIPQSIYLPDPASQKFSSYEEYEGIHYRLPTFWDIQDFDQTYNRNGYRIFDHLPVKLSDGLFTYKHFLFDEESYLPVFLANFE